jgi:Tn3 transposase DDE domain
VGSASANSYVRIHIRYDGYGGIGYYLVSDNYIVLMSRFATCGSWEGHYILVRRCLGIL